MNALSALGIGITQIPGALPQAKMKTAPLALNTYSSRPWEDSALDLHFRVGACK